MLAYAAMGSDGIAFCQEIVERGDGVHAGRMALVRIEINRRQRRLIPCPIRPAPQFLYAVLYEQIDGTIALQLWPSAKNL
ncbi:MAG: hypothetical protein ACOH2T_29200 [Pseudomonas sp.]